MPKQLPTKTYSPDDFYRAYAIAMLNWQTVESALFEFLYSLFENGNLTQAGAAYYSLNSFGAKLQLVDAMSKAVLDDAQLNGWRSLCAEIRKTSEDRNVLAHLPAAVEFQPDNSLSLVLAPHIFTPKPLIRPRKKKFGAGECEHLASEFDKLAKKIRAFTQQT